MTSIFEMSLLPERLARLANQLPRLVVRLVCAFMAVPAINTGYAALQGNLGINPLEILIRQSGKWAFIWLLIALAIVPLRHACIKIAMWSRCSYGKRLSDWNWLIHLRRPLGLASFFYAAIHLILYAVLDLDFNWGEFIGDLRNKPYIASGMAAFVLLFPLAITSTDAWRARLKRNWKHLHLLVYPAAILVEIHFILLAKPGVTDYLEYGLVLIGLLGYRLWQCWRMARRTNE